MPIPALAPTSEQAIAATRHWLERAVIGLNLCPFAKAVHVKGQIRYRVSHADSSDALLEALAEELQTLAAADPGVIDTTLLIHPQVLTDFLDYNDFLDVAEAALEHLGLACEIQIASFHPRYQFAGTRPNDIDNYTNRSPYPMLHLLREASVARAVESFPDAADIFERNIATLRALGRDVLGSHGFAPPQGTGAAESADTPDKRLESPINEMPKGSPKLPPRGGGISRQQGDF